MSVEPSHPMSRRSMRHALHGPLEDKKRASMAHSAMNLAAEAENHAEAATQHAQAAISMASLAKEQANAVNNMS